MARARVKSESAVAYLPGFNVPSGANYTTAEQRTIDDALEIIDARLRDRGESLADPSTAGRFIKLKIGGEPREVFGVLFLDTRHRVIAWEALFFGTIDGAEVSPREVVKRALFHNAAAVILGHNHPSGNADPSAADRAVTARIKQSLALVDIRLLDHFVCGEGAPTSLAARGWI